MHWYFILGNTVNCCFYDRTESEWFAQVFGFGKTSVTFPTGTVDSLFIWFFVEDFVEAVFRLAESLSKRMFSTWFFDGKMFFSVSVSMKVELSSTCFLFCAKTKGKKLISQSLYPIWWDLHHILLISVLTSLHYHEVKIIRRKFCFLFCSYRSVLGEIS